MNLGTRQRRPLLFLKLPPIGVVRHCPQATSELLPQRHLHSQRVLPVAAFLLQSTVESS
jgi:hypothetical protein